MCAHEQGRGRGRASEDPRRLRAEYRAQLGTPPRVAEITTWAAIQSQALNRPSHPGTPKGRLSSIPAGVQRPVVLGRVDVRVTRTSSAPTCSAGALWLVSWWEVGTSVLLSSFSPWVGQGGWRVWGRLLPFGSWAGVRLSRQRSASAGLVRKSRVS